MRPTVELVSTGSEKPIEIATIDARTCYSADPVGLGETMNVEAALWNTGHHTTLMAPSDFVFRIEGLSISSVTLGLHLSFPFYNTGQRSGRFCGEMFDTIEVSSFAQKLRAYRYDGAKIDEGTIKEILDYIGYGVNVFKKQRENATCLVRKLIQEDRPKASDGYADANAARSPRNSFECLFQPLLLQHWFIK
jgi:hypothetical protein